MFVNHFAQQPAFCESPVAMNSFVGDFQNLGGLFHRQAAEETELDYLRFPRIFFGELVEGLVQRDQIRQANWEK